MTVKLFSAKRGELAASTKPECQFLIQEFALHLITCFPSI